MTIFDIKPYSFWRNLHRASVYGWVHRGHDTPRTVLRLYLLEHLVQQQKRLIEHLTRDNRGLRAVYMHQTAQEGPETARTDVRRENGHANGVTPEIAPILPATNEADATKPTPVATIRDPLLAEIAKPPKHPRSGDRLPFAEFDMLVGKELKRLSVDGRIPNAGLWDEQRDKRLPTYGAVMQRYGCTNLASFAEKRGCSRHSVKPLPLTTMGRRPSIAKKARRPHDRILDQDARRACHPRQR